MFGLTEVTYFENKTADYLCIVSKLYLQTNW